jgi:hypothetical protein
MSEQRREPKVRIVVSPNGIERIEVWGSCEDDRDEAMKLYFRLSSRLQELNQACRA